MKAIRSGAPVAVVATAGPAFAATSADAPYRASEGNSGSAIDTPEARKKLRRLTAAAVAFVPRFRVMATFLAWSKSWKLRRRWRQSVRRGAVFGTGPTRPPPRAR